MQFGKNKGGGDAPPRKWQPMPEGMYRVIKLKPARGPKPGQSAEAYCYGLEQGHEKAKAAYRRKNGL